MYKKFVTSLGLAALLAASAASFAEEEIITDVFDDRWFGSLHIGGVLADDEDLDTGASFGLSLGKPLSDRWAIEGTVRYEDLETENAGNYERLGLSLQALFFINDSPFWDTDTK
ncbi:MAG: hypothetical protein ACPHER_10825, partial [Nevskiales bacterium]